MFWEKLKEIYKQKSENILTDGIGGSIFSMNEGVVTLHVQQVNILAFLPGLLLITRLMRGERTVHGLIF